MADPLAGVGDPVRGVTRALPASVTAVAGHLITVDPHDGALVTQVPWYGTSPLVGDEVVLLLCDGNLLAISAGRPS